MKTIFWDLSRQELEKKLEALGIAPQQVKMRVAQIWRAFYVEGQKDFDHITTLSKSLRVLLDGHLSLKLPKMMDERKSKDGTIKWLLEMADGSFVEMVCIPEKTRATLCISSQIGCTLNCRFCHTGTQKWQRNLTSGEIVAQAMFALDRLGEPRLKQPQLKKNNQGASAQRCQTRGAQTLTHIVFMGQGEPLFNLDAVIDAITILCDSDGLAFSRRRVTVSTSGVVPAIKRLGEETGVKLAISLHATNDKQRNDLIPLNKKYNLALLLEACRAYPRTANQSRVTFEYVMLDGVNDSDDDARALTKLIAGIPSKINLIPFNAWPQSGFEPSTPPRVKSFANIVKNAGYAAPIRRARGSDIMAACGQLKSESISVKSAALGEL